MSLSIIEKQIEAFLNSESTKVLVIRGKWGVGKTFFWHKMLNKYKANLAGINHYSYVSLFGLDDISLIKNNIYLNSIDSKIIGEQPNLETIMNNITKIGSYGKKYSKKVGFFSAERYYRNT